VRTNIYTSRETEQGEERGGGKEDVNYKSILSRWELRQRVHSSQPIFGSEPFSGLSHLVCLPK